MRRFNQTGTVPVLILVAVIGLVAFLAISSTFGFKDHLFSSLFPKPASQAATNTDVTSLLENLGNPTKAKWADNTSNVYSRNPWDMQVFNNKVYIGSGDAVSNKGPIDLLYYEASTSSFKKDVISNAVCGSTCIDEEQINLFRITDNTLYIPGYDPRDDQTLGNFYRIENGLWKKFRTIPGGIHNYDIYKFQGKLFASLLGTTGSMVVSDNNGLTWTNMTFNTTNGLTAGKFYFFELGGSFYASGQLMTDSLIVKYDGTNTWKDQGTSISNGLFPQSLTTGGRSMGKAANFNGQLIYTGKNTNGTPIGLYRATSLTNAQQISLPNNIVPQDLVVSGSAVYILAQTGTSPNVVNYVYSSTDLTNWTEVLHFTSDTFARSFEYQNGYFYFGMGTEATPLSNTAGTIYRVQDPTLSWVTPENLSNPFNYTSSNYPNNVWDMQTFNGKIYLAYGDGANNILPNSLPIISYDPTLTSPSTGFTKEFIVNEEQLSLFRIIDGQILAPGSDSQEGWDLGNFYLKETNGWVKHRTIPGGIHVFDMYKFGSKLFAAIGTSGPSAVQGSLDNGITWQDVTLPLYNTPVIGPTALGRVYNFFERGNKFYAWSSIPSLLEFDGNNTFIDIPSSTFSQLFPGASTPQNMSGRKEVHFNNQLFYIGVLLSGDAGTIPIALYKVSDDPIKTLLETLPTASQINLPGSAVPQDTLTTNGKLYILGNIKVANNSYIVTVSESSDGVTFKEILRFNTITFARSFEILNNDFYFGLGTDLNVNSSDTGKILRVKTNSTSPSPSLLPSLSPSPNPLPGDIVVNGKVDIFDYNALLQDFGKTSGFNPASDIVMNGKIDIFDYNGLLQNFGRTQ